MKKIKFNNGTVPALSAENMNELQDNIEVEINKNSNVATFYLKWIVLL